MKVGGGREVGVDEGAGWGVGGRGGCRRREVGEWGGGGGRRYLRTEAFVVG